MVRRDVRDIRVVFVLELWRADNVFRERPGITDDDDDVP